MSANVPPHLAHNRGTVITASKRPPPAAAAPPVEKRPRALAQPLKLPPEAAALLGPLADSFHRLSECEERIDQAIERGKLELRSVLSGPVEGKDVFPGLNACMPRPMLRGVRVYVSSTYEPIDATPSPASAGETTSADAKWSLRVTAAVRSARGDNGEGAFNEAVPLHQFFDIVHVQVATPGQTTKAEWRAADGEDALCPGVSIVRTASLTVPEMPSRVALRLKQRTLSSGAGPVSPLARVQVARHLATLLHLSPEHHYSYFEVEEALWLFLKERRCVLWDEAWIATDCD